MALTMTQNAFVFLLQALRISDEAFRLTDETLTREAYLKARDEWLEQGCCRLELDGSLRLSEAVRRELFTLRHFDRIQREETEGCIHIWVENAIERLDILAEQEQVSLVRTAKEAPHAG